MGAMRRGGAAHPAAALALLACLAPPAARGQVGWPAVGPEMCVVLSTEPVRPQSTCADFGVGMATSHGDLAPGSAAIDVAAMRGERESVQLLLRKAADLDDPVGGLDEVEIQLHLEPQDLLERVEMRRVGYVRTLHSARVPGSGGGWRPDPLLPLPRPLRLAASETQALWLDLVISRDAPAGEHAGGSVVLNATNSRGEPVWLVLPFKITVWDLTLPTFAESAIGTAWSGSWEAETFRPFYPNLSWGNIKKEWYDLMMDHRMPPDSIYLDKPRPLDDLEYMGKRGVKNFALLDVSRLPLHPGAAVAPLRAHNGGNFVRVESCPLYTDEYVSRLLKLLRPAVEALERAKLLSSAYVYGFDEQPQSCEPQVRQLFGAVKKAFPGLRTAAVLNWSPMPVELPIDIWIFQYQKFNASDAAAWVGAGKEQWQYHCIEPDQTQFLNTFIERPSLQGRLLFWLAALRQLEHGAPSGWLYYYVNLWQGCSDPTKCAEAAVLGPAGAYPYTNFSVANFIWRGEYDDIFANGDGMFVYPCPDGHPCPSVRLAAIRDGLEDWELFSRAPAAARRRIAMLLRGIVRDSWDWSRDPFLLERVRREAAAAAQGGDIPFI